MHRSRLAGFIIDCQNVDPDAAARFWGPALGMPLNGTDANGYVRLDASARDIVVEVQKVSHESRLHLDIESDDIDAEVRRLEKLGARVLERVKTWVVLEAPTGQRFCVVRAKSDLTNAPGATSWPD